MRRPSIPDLNRPPMIRPSGKAMAHDATPVRFVLPIPGHRSVTKTYRDTKDRNAPVPDPYGTPHHASDARDERMRRK